MAGSINKRRKGNQTKWRARYPDPSYGGKKEIERTFDRKADAERWLRGQQVSVDRGVHIDPGNSDRALSHVIDEWRGTWGHLEPKTKAGYETILNRHVLPRWRDARVGAVSAHAVQEWVNELAAKRKPATVRRIYGVLQSILKLAVERNYITVNPCAAVRLPRTSTYGDRATTTEMQFLTAAEVAALAEQMTYPQDRVLIYTAAYSGLRSGELGALRRKDVDLLHGKLRVSRALKIVETASENIPEEEKGILFGPTKSGKARTVGLPRFLVAMLTDHLKTIPADPDALVFTSPEGGPRRQGNFYRRHFKPAVRRRYCAECQTTVKTDAEDCPECNSADLRYVLPHAKHALRFHDLRHTCASLLIAANAHPKAIQDHLGHADIQTTFNVYGHLLPQAHDALSAALDAAYAGSEGADDDIPRIGAT